MHSKFPRKWLIAFIAVPTAIGLLTGWLVGVSESPVVSALLPLVFGLVGAAAYGLIEQRAKAEHTLENLLAIGEVSALSDAAKAQIAEQVGVVGIRPPWLPVLWTVGVLVFCLTCAAGILVGVRQRVPEYPTLDNLLGTAVKPTEQERAKLYEAYWLLRAQNVPPNEVRDVFETVFNVILDPAKTYPTDRFHETPADARFAKVEQAVRTMKFDAKLRRPTLAE